MLSVVAGSIAGISTLAWCWFTIARATVAPASRQAAILRPRTA